MDTLNTTALVHDLYLQMAKHDDIDFRDEISFYAYAAKAMRHLLIDRARGRESRPAAIRCGYRIDAHEQDDWSLDAFLADPQPAFELDSALAALTREDARAAHVVELYLFGGLTITRIADSGMFPAAPSIATGASRAPSCSRPWRHDRMDHDRPRRCANGSTRPSNARPKRARPG